MRPIFHGILSCTLHILPYDHPAGYRMKILRYELETNNPHRSQQHWQNMLTVVERKAISGSSCQLDLSKQKFCVPRSCFSVRLGIISEFGSKRKKVRILALVRPVNQCTRAPSEPWNMYGSLYIHKQTGLNDVPQRHTGSVETVQNFAPHIAYILAIGSVNKTVFGFYTIQPTKSENNLYL